MIQLTFVRTITTLRFFYPSVSLSIKAPRKQYINEPRVYDMLIKRAGAPYGISVWFDSLSYEYCVMWTLHLRSGARII